MRIFIILWFMVCACLALSIIIGFGYTIFHPDMIGSFFGQIVHGFNSTKGS